MGGCGSEVLTLLRKEHTLRSWNGFLKKLPTLGKRGLVFRGHADSRWSLQTTLERRGRVDMSLDSFYLMMSRVLPQIESSTGRAFDVPSYPSLRWLFNDYHEFSRMGFPPDVCAYFIYARHHGFPSPLLDWSRSPYVAAFFAFAAEQPAVKYRSIYAWSKPMFSSGGTDEPELRRIGQFVRTHPRHVLQQCDYSFRATFRTDKHQWYFTEHEDAFAGDEALASERLTKFNIPSSERSKVLKFLDAFNLNAYSLYGSEESLMETLALREFDLKAPDGRLRRQPH